MPMCSVVKEIGGKWKCEQVPLFSNMMFVHSTHDVFLNLVKKYTAAKSLSVIISDDEMKKVIKFANLINERTKLSQLRYRKSVRFIKGCDNLLAHSFTVGAHPAKYLSIEDKITYVKAVGEVLSLISDERKKLHLAYSIWCKSLSVDSRIDSVRSSNFIFLTKAMEYFGSSPKSNYLCIALALDCLTIVEKVLGDVIFYVPIIISSLPDNFNWAHYVICALSIFKGKANEHKLLNGMLAQWQMEKSFVQRKEKRIVFAATMSAGKSTLVNAIVGHKINEVRATACTSRVHYIHNRLQDKGVMVRFGNDKYVYTDDYQSVCSELIDAASIHFESNLNKERICLIDTPGDNFNGDSTHRQVMRSVFFTNDFDLLVVVLNSLQLGIYDESIFLKYISETCKGKVIFALNKLDCYNPEDGDSIEYAMLYARQMLEECGIKNPTIIPVSGRGAFLIRKQKQSKAFITASESLELSRIRHLSESGHFNLPQYVSSKTYNNDGDDLLWCTGVPLLEKVIIDNLIVCSTGKILRKQL